MSLSHEQLRDLSRVIENYYEENKASAELYEIAEDFVKKVTQAVQTVKTGPLMGEQIMADVFGSLSNGLGTMESDVDICLRIIGKSPPEKKTIVSYLQSIIKPLKDLGCEVEDDALKAKVPILKIKWRPPQKKSMVLEGDISFYHALSLQHAALIKAYCDCDPRVAKLGLFLKEWAKTCGIGSAKDGYISSYSWSLMLIQYLQLVKPEVVPNLQKLTTPGKPRHVLEGVYNIYFYRGTNPKKMSSTKQGYSSTSLAELFIGFMKYYVNYNFDKQKVAIDRDSRAIPTPFGNRSMTISEPFTSMYSGIQNEGCIERRNNIIQCLATSILVFQSKEIRNEAKSAVRNNNYKEFLNEYEEALFEACPTVDPSKHRISFIPGKCEGKTKMSVLNTTQNHIQRRAREDELQEDTPFGSKTSLRRFINYLH